MSGTNNRPLILVTNDDGYKAKGIQKLSEIAREFGDVVVIAASESQSGQSQSITIKEPLKYKKIHEEEGFVKYVVRGTPADGVKLALCSILDRKPDFLFSGINHGTNSSTSIVYSGTMGATIEGAIQEIPSAGFSLLDYMPDADFESSAPFVRHIIKDVIENGLPKNICLNVNIPDVPREQIKGIKVCRQADGYWKEEFEERKDPRGSKYYWLSGSFENREEDATDTDEAALKDNYLSLVPVNIDFTAYNMFERMSSCEITSVPDEN